ncbi:exodeoxyribonuclease VII large subunit [Aquisediminimonas profunda]|uniref:exodeoxyribonuclease VII large subunit n=1 Tax=Aquisediminimonas profunda TaxID=1550733 RepID=UPI001C62F02C|nr:exodeoxyribonuclease VII large subunit [Aquisediminimonas profunda]
MEEDTPPLDEMRLLAEERQGDNSGVLSVSEISSALKRHVEQGFGHVRIRGEISGFKRATSGHLYLSLKDENAKIDGVMWKGNAARIPFVPQDGVEIIATGKLTTYPGRSSYQIVIDSMEIAGEGALLALLEKLKVKLQAEGLFDAARKRQLPFLPRTIGVVTSPTGAVIRDILHRLADRCPTRVIVWPVLVQGHGSAEQVAAAVSGFSAMQGADRPDLIIVARGGGSIEDLWGFNEEIVVRAVATSTIPVISAVGHETDTTLCDFAADVRAPTPTAAAELAVPVRAELLAGLQSAQARALRAVRRYAERADERLIATARRLPSLDTLLGPQRQKVDDFSDRLRRGLSHRLSDARGDLARVSGALRPVMLTQRLANAEQRLAQIWRLAESLHPEKPLQRGYVLVKDRQGGVVSSVTNANRAKMLTLTFADGEVPVRVEQEGRPAYDRPKPDQPSLL